MIISQDFSSAFAQTMWFWNDASKNSLYFELNELIWLRRLGQACWYSDIFVTLPSTLVVCESRSSWFESFSKWIDVISSKNAHDNNYHTMTFDIKQMVCAIFICPTHTLQIGTINSFNFHSIFLSIIRTIVYAIVVLMVIIFVATTSHFSAQMRGITAQCRFIDGFYLLLIIYL